MFTIFVIAVAVGVFVMYFRGEHQLKQRRKANPPTGELPDATANAEPERDPPADNEQR